MQMKITEVKGGDKIEVNGKRFVVLDVYRAAWGSGWALPVLDMHMRAGEVKFKSINDTVNVIN